LRKPGPRPVPEILPVEHTDHEHRQDPIYLQAATSLIDKNMYVFSDWVRNILKNTPGLKRSQKLLLRGFFKFVQKNLHKARCAETWHYLGELTDKIIALSGSETENLDELATKLAAPETKQRLKESLGLSEQDAEQITAVEIARAFRKMFKVEQAKTILKEFRAQIQHVEDNLIQLGFP
jgi:hypothetical protein